MSKKSYDKRYEYTIDTSLVEELFQSLDYKNQAKVIKYGLRDAANMITRRAKKNLKSQMGKSATRKHAGWGKKSKKTGLKGSASLVLGIATAVDKKNGIYAVAHIRGNGLLHLFEGGTVMRHKNNKKQSNTGQITALYFFKSAVNAEEKNAQLHLVDCVAQQIIKIYEKKLK